MRASHKSIQNYLSEHETFFLGKTFYSPILLSPSTLLFFNVEERGRYCCFNLSKLNPCFFVGKTEAFYTSLKSKFCSQLKAISDQFMIVDYEFAPNDYLLTFRIAISNEKKDDLFFYFEMFSNNPNLFVADQNSNIKISFNFNENEERKIDTKYIEKSSSKFSENNVEFDEKYIAKIIENSLEERRKEKYGEFIKNYQLKIKKSKKKIQNIENDKINAESSLKYQQIADNLLSSGINLKQHLSSTKCEDCVIELDSSKTVGDNIQHFYKLAKKAKTAIALANDNIERAKNEIELYESILQKFNEIPNEKDADKYVAQFAPNKKKETIETVFNKPWKINYQGVYFYFGKNSAQNDYLSFAMKQDRQYTWLHIKDRPGSHVVIASLKPTEDQLLFAAELCLMCSKATAGDIQYTKKKNIRHGHSLGEAIVKNYSVIKINNIRERSHEVFKTAQRCD